MSILRIKKFIILLLSILFFIQCKTMKENRREIKQFKSIYLAQFKLTYTRKLLQAGFNHSPAINSILETDPKGFTEPILSDADYQLVDSWVYIEGSEGKHVLRYLIDRYETKWLDSLAKARYKTLGVKKF